MWNSSLLLPTAAAAATDWDRDAADPDIFLVHAVRDPHRAVLPRAVARPLGDAADVLWARHFVQTWKPQRRLVAEDDAHAGERDAVVAVDDDERETLGGVRVVDQRIAAVARALAPHFRAARDERARAHGR